MTLDFDNPAERERMLRLACRAFHRFARARDAMHAGNSTEAVAQYFAADAEILPRLFNMLPADIKEELLAMVAATVNEGK